MQSTRLSRRRRPTLDRRRGAGRGLISRGLSRPTLCRPCRDEVDGEPYCLIAITIREDGHLIDLGTFATGVLTGLGTSALLAALFKRFLEAGIANWFKKLQQARGIVGQAEI